MNISRRNFLVGTGVIGVSAAVSGCKFPLNGEQGHKIGVGVGGATGLVLDACGLDDDSRNAVVGVVGEINRVVPQEGETVTDAMSRVAKKYIAGLEKAGKLTPAQATAVNAAVTLLLKGWGIIEERHPVVKAWCSLSAAVVGGFCDGFLAVYKPVNGECGDGCCEIDTKAFKMLQNSTEVRSLRIKALRGR